MQDSGITYEDSEVEPLEESSNSTKEVDPDEPDNAGETTGSEDADVGEPDSKGETTGSEDAEVGEPDSKGETTGSEDADAGEPDSKGETTNLEYKESNVTIPVTWTALPEYDMETEGVYVFTPVIDGYTVSAVLPEITVIVSELPPLTAAMTLLGTPASLTVSTEAELHAAILSVENGGTIFLGDNISLSSAVVIEVLNNKSFT